MSDYTNFVSMSRSEAKAYLDVFLSEMGPSLGRFATSVDCELATFTTVKYETPFVFDDTSDTWVPGVEVEIGRSGREATSEELAAAKCSTPPKPDEPVVESSPPPGPAQATRDVVASYSPAVPTAVAPAASRTALPSTGIDGTGITALIALLITSLGGAALFLSRRHNVTT